MNKLDILREATFGQRVAEDEGDSLASYFVETDQWQRLFAGKIDIVFGPKGSGKSAFYLLLLQRANLLEEKGIIVEAAENPRGTPVFRDLTTDPPGNELEFQFLWKLYFLSLVGGILQANSADTASAKQLIGALADAGVVNDSKNLRRLLPSTQELMSEQFNKNNLDVQQQVILN